MIFCGSEWYLGALTKLYSRYVNVGLFYLRQLFFAKFDLKVHTDQGQCGVLLG